MLLPGVIERLAKDVLRVLRQVVAHARRQFVVAGIRHGAASLTPATAVVQYAQTTGNLTVAVSGLPRRGDRRVRARSDTSTLPFVSGPTSSANTKLISPTVVPTSMEVPNPTP